MNKELLDTIETLVSEINDLKVIFNEKIEAKESQLVKLIEKVTKFEEEKESKFESFDKYVESIKSSVEIQFKSIDNAVEKVDLLSKQLAECEQKIDFTKKQICEIEDVIKSNAENAEVIKSFLNAQNEHFKRIETIENSLKVLEEKTPILTSKIRGISKSLTEIKEIQDYANATCDKCSDKVDDLNCKISQLKAYYDELTKKP